MKLKNKICVITGGASGIGRAIAERFAKEGGGVVIVDITKNAGSHGGVFLQYDVSKVQDVKNAVASIKKRFGRIDILVNNAGIYPQEARVEAMGEALWEKVLGVNLTGSFLLSKYALPLLKKSRSPVIINIASVLGLIPEVGSAAYCVSKAGLIMLTKALALEEAPKIRVNAIAPGPIDTPLLRRAFKTKRELNEYIKKHTLYGRLGTPEEVANVALFLVSDEASYVTGAIYSVDGGEFLSS